MDFEFYRNFITIAETGNLTEAARKLSLAQPALSAQLKAIERCYGAELVQTGRGRRHIALTEAGQKFLAKAKELCLIEESMHLDIQAYTQVVAGTLHICCSPAQATYFIRTYLEPFAAAHPQVMYQFQEASAEKQMELISNNSCDFGYANAPLAYPEHFTVYCEEREYFYAVYSKDNALNFTTDESVTLGELRTYPLSCNYGCYGLVRNRCKLAGFVPHFTFIATTNTAVLAYAAGCHAIAICALPEAKLLPANLCASKIADPSLYFDKSFFYLAKATLSPVAKLFLAHFLKIRQEREL